MSPQTQGPIDSNEPWDSDNNYESGSSDPHIPIRLHSFSLLLLYHIC